MKKLLLLLALLIPSAAFAQCNGVFPNNTVCGNISGSSNLPRAMSPSAFLGAAGGSNGQIQYNNSSALGGFTMAGDCTVAIPNITCTKTAGTPFSAFATATDMNTQISRFNSGTGASATTYWSGAGTWTSPTGLRKPNPTNLYVTKTGSDSNDCTLTGASACLTIQRAVNVALGSYDFQGANLTINVGAGTYVESVQIYGPFGGPGTTASGAQLNIKGAGSATTSIAPTTGCSSGVGVRSYARVGLGSIAISTTCASASALLITDYSIASPIDNDLLLGGAPNAVVLAAAGSAFDCNINGSFKITLQGNATFAFLISTQSRVVTGAGVTNVLIGTPAYSFFVDAIDGSFFNWGSSSTWSGSATGRRYTLALNSYIDSEQITTNLPGNDIGIVASGSYYYTNGPLTCIGSQASCRSATAPTGFGASPTLAVAAGSGDQSGQVVITAGAGAATTGTLVIATPSIVQGPIDNRGWCIVGPSNAGTAWPTQTVMQADYTAGGLLNVSWTTSAALTNTANYAINYICQ